MLVGFKNCLTQSIIQDSDSLLFSYLFLKTFAILPAEIRFISDTHSIIPAEVTKLFKLQNGDIKKLPFEPIFKLSVHATGVTKESEIESWIPSKKTNVNSVM